VIIDAYQEHFHGSGWAAIADAGVDGLCSLLAERSQSALPRLLGEGVVADAAFVGLPARSAGVRCRVNVEGAQRNGSANWRLPSAQVMEPFGQDWPDAVMNEPVTLVGGVDAVEAQELPASVEPGLEIIHQRHERRARAR
jgi:hypothetical protein